MWGRYVRQYGQTPPQQVWRMIQGWVRQKYQDVEMVEEGENVGLRKEDSFVEENKNEDGRETSSEEKQKYEEEQKNAEENKVLNLNEKKSKQGIMISWNDDLNNEVGEIILPCPNYSIFGSNDKNKQSAEKSRKDTVKYKHCEIDKEKLPRKVVSQKEKRYLSTKDTNSYQALRNKTHFRIKTRSRMGLERRENMFAEDYQSRGKYKKKERDKIYNAASKQFESKKKEDLSKDSVHKKPFSKKEKQQNEKDSNLGDKKENGIFCFKIPKIPVIKAGSRAPLKNKKEINMIDSNMGRVKKVKSEEEEEGGIVFLPCSNCSSITIVYPCSCNGRVYCGSVCQVSQHTE